MIALVPILKETFPPILLAHQRKHHQPHLSSAFANPSQPKKGASQVFLTACTRPLRYISRTRLIPPVHAIHLNHKFLPFDPPRHPWHHVRDRIRLLSRRKRPCISGYDGRFPHQQTLARPLLGQLCHSQSPSRYRQCCKSRGSPSTPYSWGAALAGESSAIRLDAAAPNHVARACCWKRARRVCSYVLVHPCLDIRRRCVCFAHCECNRGDVDRLQCYCGGCASWSGPAV